MLTVCARLSGELTWHIPCCFGITHSKNKLITHSRPPIPKFLNARNTETLEIWILENKMETIIDNSRNTGNTSTNSNHRMQKWPASLYLGKPRCAILTNGEMTKRVSRWLRLGIPTQFRGYRVKGG